MQPAIDRGSGATLAACARGLGLLLLAAAAGAQAPPAELIYFTADGQATSPLLFPGFRHDSVWSGLAAGSDGNVYACVSNHRQPGGNVALFRWEPAASRMTLLGDLESVSSAAANWMPNESQYKVHTFPLELDGKLWLASMDHAPTPFLRGAHVYTIDLASGTVADFSKTQPFLMTESLVTIPNTGQAQVRSGVFIETYGVKGLGLNPRAPERFYAMTFPDGHLISYELGSGALEVVGQSPDVGYVFYVDNRGNVYYARPSPVAGFELVKYVAATGATQVVQASIPGFGIGAIAPTADGETVYVLESESKSIYVLDCLTDQLTFFATCCGTNWWRLYNLSLDPAERGLWYVSNNNSRSTLRRIDLVTKTCEEVLDIDALLGTRNLCFGGVGVWDSSGDLYTPVWTLGGVDVALLRTRLGQSASFASRNAGANPASYTVTGAPHLNATITCAVDLTTTGHGLAQVFAFAGPLQLTLAGGQILLTDVTHPWGELLQLGLQSGPLATFPVSIPNQATLAGLGLSTQAVHLGGVVPFALSNAQDWTIGF